MAEFEPLPGEIKAYYERRGESTRLSKTHGLIELARTQEIILRHLPPPPGTILDVGGGPGVYAAWLAARGYSVHLVDAMPLHVEQARQASARQPDTPVASLRVGDARRLEASYRGSHARQVARSHARRENIRPTRWQRPT